MISRCQVWFLWAAVLCAGVCAHAQTDSTAQKPASEHEKIEASRAFLNGAKALKENNLREAEKQFEQAKALDPGNTQYSVALTIAKEHLLTQLVQEAGKARLMGQDNKARSFLAEAYLLDPNNRIVQQHIDDLARDSSSHEAVLLPATEEAAPPVELAPKEGKQSFHIRSAATDVLRQVLTAFGITPTLDTSIRNQIVRIDADDVTFEQAATMLKLTTNTFFVPLDEKRVLIAQDTKENRAKFEREVMETVYLPGLTATEMSDMGNIARNVFEAQQATIQAQAHTLTVRAPQGRISALNRTFVDLLDGRSQVLLNLRLFQVARTRMTNIGAELPQTTTVFNVPTEVNQIIQANQSAVQQIIASGLAPAGDDVAIVAILVATGVVTGTVFNQPFALFGGGITQMGLTLNQGATVNLALNSSDTRALDQVQLRIQDQEDATIRSGTRYPIITSTYSGLTGNSLGIPGVSSAGISSALQNLGISSAALQSTINQTIPQVQYEDLGLTLKATPHIQQNKDVALKLDLKIESLTGQTLNANPILNSQQYTGTVTLPQGESALVISNLNRQQSAAVSGIPGLSELPGFQSTTNKEGNVDVSKLVILITPQIVRLSHTKPASQLVMLPVHP
jgi:type II secretory pathway component GspD/PulD (secretin)